MATVTWTITVREQRHRRQAARREIRSIAESVATYQLLERQDWSAYQDYISRLLEVKGNLVFIAVYDERRSLRAYALNLDLIELPADSQPDRRRQADLVRRLDEGQIAEGSRDEIRTQQVNIQIGDRVLGSVSVGVSLLDINRALRNGVRRNVLAALGFLILSGILSFLLSRRLTRPIEQLNQAMRAIAFGRLTEAADPETHDEISELTRTFNEMVVGLRERREIEQLGQELGSTFQQERLVPLLKERLRGAIGAAETRLLLRHPAHPGCFRELGAPEGPSPPGTALLPEALQERLLARLEGVYVDTDSPALREALAAWHFSPRDLALPMTVKGKLLGLLVFRPYRGDAAFGEKRRHLASTLAGQAALALENSMLYEELREQERLRSELAVARAVQQKLLPRATPVLPGFAFDALCRPAHEVGGDYYDFHGLEGNKLGVVIADVSGKGASASLYMAEIKGMMLSLALRHDSPKTVLEELNRHLCPSLDRGVFASILYAVLDPAVPRITFARAGHAPPLLVRASGHTEALRSSGIALGLDAGPLFEKSLIERELALEDGDTLLLYTDGLTDTMNVDRQTFGTRRLQQVARETAGSSPERLRERILDRVAGFAAGTPQFDDLTLVILSYRTPAGDA